MTVAKLFQIFRPALHLIYLVAAVAVCGYFVFRVGVPSVGDHPGAVAAGILPGIFIYLFLVVAESVLECFTLVKRSWLGLILQVLAALGSIGGAWVCLWAVLLLFTQYMNSDFVALAMLVVLFVFFESMFFRRLNKKLNRYNL